MGLSDLFANNLFVKLLRGDRAKHDLIVSMVGTRLGDRVLVLGGGDGELVAALGRPTGLTGRVCAVEPDEARAERVRSSATAAGVLLEVETAAPGSLPYDAGSFDVVVVPPAADVTESMSEVWRVLRIGRPVCRPRNARRLGSRARPAEARRLPRAAPHRRARQTCVL